MPEEILDLYQRITEAPQSTFERTLVAEYLFSQGYLLSDLKKLPVQAANSLMTAAHRHTALRLGELMSGYPFWYAKARLALSLN